MDNEKIGKNENNEAAGKKGNKRKKQSSFIKAVCITVGILIVVIALLFIFKRPIIGYLFKPDRGASGPETLNPDDTDTSLTIPLQNQDQIYNFLIVGHDRAANLADVSMLVNYNVADCTARIMQIPRDTYVDYDNYWYHKINGVYSYYMDDEAENPELEGIKGYAEFLEENFCVDIDYYAVMDLDQFVNIVDALGGVDIYIAEDMYYRDPNQDLTINLKAGQQTLDGKMAEQFVRYRSGYMQGDIGRGQAQKQFMAALFNTIKNKTNILNIGKICGIVTDNLVTNMTTQDLIYFATYAVTVKLENIIMLTLPGNTSSTGDGLSYYSINREATLEAVNLYFNIRPADITDEEFDKDHVFDNGGAVYSGSKEATLDYVYDADTLVNGDEDIPK